MRTINIIIISLLFLMHSGCYNNLVITSLEYNSVANVLYNQDYRVYDYKNTLNSELLLNMIMYSSLEYCNGEGKGVADQSVEKFFQLCNKQFELKIFINSNNMMLFKNINNAINRLLNIPNIDITVVNIDLDDKYKFNIISGIKLV